MSKSVITMTKTVQRLQDQLAIAWDRVTKAERETIEKDEQLAEAKQWKDISVHQGLKIKSLEAELFENDVAARHKIEKYKCYYEITAKSLTKVNVDLKKAEAENAELQTAYNDYVGRNNRLIEGNLELKKENAELRELLLEVWNDWKNSPNVNDPEADGYELLQKIKKAVKHE